MRRTRTLVTVVTVATVATLAASVFCSGCIDAPLSDAELNDRIAKQSKALPTPLLVANCLAKSCQGNSNACQTDCFAKASKSAKNVGRKLWDCWKTRCHEDMCLGGGDAMCMSQCLLSRCGGETIASIETGKSGARTCSDTLSCMELCDTAKPALFTCYEQCWALGSEVGHKGLQQLAQCSVENDGNAKAKCHVELVACFSDTLADSGKCHTLFACAEACTDPDATKNGICQQTCRDKLSANAKLISNGMTACSKGNEGSEKCQNAVVSCIGPSGAETCSSALACYASCHDRVGKSTDQTGCLYSCMHNGSLGEVENAFVVAQCLSDNAGGKCAASLTDCAKPSGSDACQHIHPCVTDCVGADEGRFFTCVLQCMATGTQQAAQKYAEWLLCLLPCDGKCGADRGCKKACNAKCNKLAKACADD